MVSDSYTTPAQETLDGPITRNEIFMGLGKLKNGKACSPLDEVGSERLKRGGGGMHDMLYAFLTLHWDCWSTFVAPQGLQYQGIAQRQWEGQDACGVIPPCAAAVMH